MSYSIVSKASQIYSTNELDANLNKSDFWIDFSDTNCFTLTSATRINTVVDKSSSPKTVTRTGTIFYDTLSKGIRFSSGNFLTISVQSPGTTGATAQESGFAVVSQFSSDNNSTIIGGALNTRNIRLGNVIAYSRTGSGAPSTGANPQLGVKFLVSWVLLNGVVTIYLNGVFDSTGAVTFTVQEPTQQVGQSQSSTTFFMRGSLYEMILFNSSCITESQRRIIENYLLRKWRIPTTSIISSPLSISGCTLWLDGNDASTITISSGTSVSQWSDKSGNNYHATQSTSSKQPTYDSTLKGLKFTTVSNTGFITSAPWSLTETLFVVVNLAARATVIGTGTNASSTKGRNLRIGSGNPPLLLSNDLTLITGTINITDTTSRFIFEYYYNSSTTTSEITRNSIQDGESNTSLTIASNTYNTIGASKSATDGDPYNSYIYEVILFNSALSVSDRLSIYKYLVNKWSITNSPEFTGRFPFYYSPPTNRLFRPVDFENLVIWLDGSDLSTLTLSGTNITSWTDKSGNGNTATAGNNPVYAAKSLNNLSTIQLRANNDYFLVSNNLTTGTYPSLCYFIVLNPSSSQPNTTYAGVLSTDTAGAFGRSLGFGGGNYQEEYYSNFVNITPYTANSWAIVCLQFTATNAATLRVNGVSYTGTLSGTGTNTTGFKIGSYNSTNGYADFNANFDVAEILVYGTNLSLYQQQVIEGYLAWKWGLISTLTSGHLFKTTLPNSDIFDIRSIPRLTLWADGSNTTTLTLSGSNVTAWADTLQYSGSTTNFAGTSTYSLTTRRLTFDGATVLQFNTTNANTMFQNISYMACFAVVSTSAANGVIFCAASSGGGLMRFDCRFSGQKLQANARRLTTDGASSLTGPTTVPLNTLILAGFVADTSSNNDLIVYYNGTQDAISSPFAAAGNTSNTADDFISLAGRSSLVSHPALSGTIGEVVVLNRIITTFQRQLIEGDLAWKWGIQSSLPSTHPYYKYPPY
jgi:hypothetical protein